MVIITGVFLTVFYLHTYCEVVCTRVNDPPSGINAVYKPYSYKVVCVQALLVYKDLLQVVCTRVNKPFKVKPKDLLQVVEPHSYAGFKYKEYRYAQTNFKFV